MKTKQEYLELAEMEVNGYITAAMPFRTKETMREEWVKERAEVLELRDRVQELEAQLSNLTNSPGSGYTNIGKVGVFKS